MIDTKSLPSSEAEPLSESFITNKEFKFTFTESVDENNLYNEINKRLLILEKSLEENKDELISISHITNEFKLKFDEKEEILLRINWLNRLYKAKEEITSIDSKEKAKSLRASISSVQTCPLKKQLMDEIDQIEQSLPEEKVTPKFENQLMEKAIEEIGDIFINLGSAGREFVISNVIKEFGENTNIDNIKESTQDIEKRVKDISQITDRSEMVIALNKLPLNSFTHLQDDRKSMIVNYLLQNKKWNGLASLDRIISQQNNAITAELKKKQEDENIIITPDGKAAIALDVEYDENTNTLKNSD